MKGIQSISIFIITLIMFLMSSCEKPKKYSPIPEISFNNLSVENGDDTLGNTVYKFVLSFNFIDGDGDLGLSSKDTLGNFAPSKEHYYNLYINLFEKKNGTFIKNETISFPYRFQNISKPSTNNPMIKGEMIINFDLSQTVEYSDTCYLEFYIFDRSLNQSNTEKSNEIFLNH